ncbi:pyridoxamine 5'-phosphate oxidase family protein [Thioclava sp. GXIMD2076]|uniref:Pyridoxamine 5'-phosphate oxidase family protein n=1 Tax=Thioclava kandeliae TaxID=3070818 RepID=A0ABV1SC70_9RHOB
MPTPIDLPKDQIPLSGARQPVDPVHEADADSRALARKLIAQSQFAAIGTLDPQTGFPHVSRIAIGTGPQGGLWSLVSGISVHARALEADPRAGILIGIPGAKGDPLTHPRLSLQVEAIPLDRLDPRHPSLRDRWLADHPKSKLYIDLGDFHFIEFRILAAQLNGGFARSYRLTPADLVEN